MKSINDFINENYIYEGFFSDVKNTFGSLAVVFKAQSSFMAKYKKMFHDNPEELDSITISQFLDEFEKEVTNALKEYSNGKEERFIVPAETLAKKALEGAKEEVKKLNLKESDSVRKYMEKR